MSESEVHIRSYFSKDIDLSLEFSGWSEFVKGKGYDVLLASPDGEEVSIYFVDDGIAYVSIKSNQGGQLFHLALGFLTYLLAYCSDNLLLDCVK